MDLQFPLGLAEPHRRIVAAWVTENGLDPKDIPVDAKMTIADDTLTIEKFVRDENGRVVVETNNVLRETVTVPLRKPWPGLSRP
ncbi:hypothetical protein [Micromonospora robiginosa]|uniref:Uncharacterized protein n=1 Tax=Micromonospora robiginosa TaxID=2749844 RepID=A0A7L6B7Z9_9ACTN|nr:hypothetical protein [Micromonospora ferruginea]QLQ37975.1 hypothetical protein H1D33_03520 [Micromonospora ferruginea]